MRAFVLIVAAALSACASGPEEVPGDVLAIRDYVEVAELPEVDRIRTFNDAGHENLGNERFMFLKVRRDTYLIEFVRDCWELNDTQRITPDRRRDPGYIRPGMDTYRGCLIGNAWALNDAQVEEIRNIGEAPTGG